MKVNLIIVLVYGIVDILMFVSKFLLIGGAYLYFKAFGAFGNAEEEEDPGLTK